MPKEDWKKNTIDKIFKKENLYPEKRIRTILDLACGISLKSQYIDADVRIGVDIYKPYLENIELEVDVPYVTLLYDVRKIDDIFLPKTMDLVLLLDIVEHLEKSDSMELIKKCEEIAKVAVIIETPSGYIPQDIDILGYGGHEYQTHRCSWNNEDFKQMGYSTILRDYTMSDKKRHSTIETGRNIQLIDAIKEV